MEVNARRLCRECLDVEVDGMGDLCAACVLDAEAYRAAMREMAADADFFARESADHREVCHFCGTWRGTPPLGGLRAACRRREEERSR